jgi:multicomponent Na+:H+ antiporter subunit E
MKRYLLALWLVVAWVAMWGRLSVANVVSGVLVALGLLVLLPPGGSRPHYVFRPVAILKFVVYFLRQLVVANAAVTREIVTPRDRIRTGVIAVPMEEGISDGLLVFLANVTALTPGTMPIEVVRDPPMFYVHVLHLHDVEAVRHEVRRMEHLAIRAFGSKEAVAALDGPEPRTDGDARPS